MNKKCECLNKILISIPTEYIIAVIWTVLFLIACEIQESGSSFSVFFSVVSLIGVFYSCALVFQFIFFAICFSHKKNKQEEKLKFILFTLFFIIGIIVLIFIIHNTNFRDIREITNSAKNYEYSNSFIMDEKLNVAIVLNLLFAAFIWLFYLYFCGRKLYKLLKTVPILLFEKFLRSVIVACASWLLIASNIGPMTIDASDSFKFFYIIFGSLAELAYPFFDIFEYTYQKIDEYENKQDFRKKQEKN